VTENTLLTKGVIIGIILLCIGTSVIPVLGDNQNVHIIKEQKDMDFNPAPQACSVQKKTTPFTGQIGFYLVTVNGYGTGMFFPFRRNRDHFFCCAALITLSGLFNDGYVNINNETYNQPLMIFFTGFAFVLYDEYPLRDSIRLWGFSLHHPLII
jgi:hypothetical protein